MKSETDESGKQLVTYIQDASKSICVPVPSFDHDSLQITKIKEEVEVEDCSLMMRIENETEPHYTSTVHTAHRDEPHMDDQPNNTLSLIKLVKSESSEHIVECGKRFILTSQLGRHMLHQNSCSQCDKRFTWPWMLKRHMLIHTGDTHHACPECDKRFTQAGHLKRHMLIHTGDKHHVCQECEKRFTQAGDLKKHMLIHTGDKQHACPECDKRFTQAGHLKRHVLIHTEDKQHLCSECNKRL